MLIVDNLIALRIMYLIVKPFTSWPAYKQGIIDDDGNVINSKKKSPDWTMLHKMVSKLKKFIQIAPGGKSLIASIIATYLLVKEQYEGEFEYNNLKEMFETTYNQLTESDYNTCVPLLEEIATSVGAGVAAGTTPDQNGKVEPVVRTTNNKYTKRNMMFRRKSVADFVGIK